MEEGSLTEQVRRLEDQVLQARFSNVSDTRTHAQQVFLLAGGIAAFLMPVYVSPELNALQSAFVTASLASLLLSILLSVGTLSFVLHKETSDLAKRHAALQTPASYIEFVKSLSPPKKGLDVLGTAIDILFACGIISLLGMLLCGTLSA